MWLIRAAVGRLRGTPGDDADNPTGILTALRVGYRMPEREEQDGEPGEAPCGGRLSPGADGEGLRALHVLAE